LTSEALGGRSANRGECAQACRLPYELVADGKQVSLGDRKYLLSPQDLAGLDLLPELVRAGVASLKIEGRLKSAEYVANITRIYRKALDELANGTQNTEHGTRATHRDSPIPDRTSSRYEMEMSFSRGLDTGWLGGIDNQKLVHGRFGKKRGVYLGEVAEVQGEGVFAYLEASLKPGDGVVFDAGQPEQKEEGGRVYGIKPIRGRRPLVHHVERIPLLLSFGRGAVDFSRVHPGDKIWKTSDPQLDRQLRQSFQAETPQFQRPLTLEVHGFAGSPLTVIACDELGHAVKLASEIALTAARNQPLTTERLREQLGRLGGTPFRLGELKNRLEGELLLPVRELNRLRREVVRQLEGLRAQRKRWTILSQASRLPEVRLPSSASLAPQLLVLVRNLPQLDATLQSRIQTIYCEFEDPKKYRDAVTAFRNSAFRTPHSAIFVAPPRIFKTGEEWILKQVRSCEADGYLIRNYDHLRYFANDRCVGDFSLNIANSLAADYFKNKFGLERVTASYDLNALQLEALLEAAPPEWFEVTIHQHMPMFHMEHCVFCAFLSTGTDYRNCGRPCDNHQLKLRDRVGAEHPIKADVGCRNTVFNSRAQSGADCVAPLLELGLRHFRLEFLNETPDQVAQTIASYQKLLGGEITSAQLWREVKALNQLGVTRPPDR
jgi:putative protease